MNDYRLLLLISCICLFVNISQYSVERIHKPIASQNTESLINQKLLQQARAIAVKVKANKTSGSGIIIQKNNNIYTIITNRHVVNHGDKYQIKTVDAHTHTGELVTISPQDDLAVLKFTSDRIYPIATINNAPLQIHDSLLAAGFPFNSDLLQITSGKLLLQMIKPLEQGYQLGYSNTIHKGMSGGAIFNSWGEVVGVNGRSANPIIPDYQYQDETYPSEQLQQQMVQLSWGIPINKAIQLLPNYY